MSTSTQQDAPPPYLRRDPDYSDGLRAPDPLTDAERRSIEDEMRPLPEGWIRQFDASHAHHYYVNIRTFPPRSIWVHPLDDAQFRKEQNLPPLSPRPPASPTLGGMSPTSEAKQLTKDEKAAGVTTLATAPVAGPSAHKLKGKDGKDGEHDRNVFGKMKDALIGTKEEREDRKRREAEQERIRKDREQELHRQWLERRRILMEQQRLQDQQRQQYYAATGPLGRAGYQYGTAYPPPAVPYGRRRGGGFGGGGMALPLAGGLAGGLLLGSALDGFDNDFGGGGFGGGGDFGGGDFGF